MMDLAARVRAALHTDVVSEESLAGGCVGDVRRLRLRDGRDVVAKVGTDATSGLAREGFMLTYLAEHTALPVPRVFSAEDDLLVMEYIDAGDAMTAAAEEHAADC